MPLKRCSDNGKPGWKWGDSGKCYTGPDGKKRAIKQGLSYDKEYFISRSVAERYKLMLQAGYTHEYIILLLGDF